MLSVRLIGKAAVVGRISLQIMTSIGLQLAIADSDGNDFLELRNTNHRNHIGVDFERDKPPRLELTWNTAVTPVVAHIQGCGSSALQRSRWAQKLVQGRLWTS